MLLGLPLDKCSGLPRTADYTFNMSHATEDANRLVFIPLSVSRQWRTEGGGFGGVQPPPRNSEDIGGVLDRMSKKNRRLDFLL